MKNELSSSELRVMNVIWRCGGQASAKQIVDELAKEVNYSASATYTLIYRCIKKGAAERIDPGFVCNALISQDEIGSERTDRLIDELFDGSADKLFAALVRRGKVSDKKLGELRTMVDEMEAQADDFDDL